MLVISAMILGGLAALNFGAEFLVEGSACMARRYGVSHLVIGLTIVALGTSLPEMMVSTQASLDGRGDIALGNVVGSNLFNVAIILGLSALIRNVNSSEQLIKRDAPIMIAVSLLLLLILIDGTISRPEALILFVGIVAYVFGLIAIERKNKRACENDVGRDHYKHGIAGDLALVLGGLGALVVGARLLLIGAVDLAKSIGVTEAVIGLTLVATGTSLPELATSLVATRRKEYDIAIGNVVGSNIFNILAILGVSGLLRPIEMVDMTLVDIYVMIGVSSLLLLFMFTGRRISRWEGITFLAIYTGYMYYLASL